MLWRDPSRLQLLCSFIHNVLVDYKAEKTTTFENEYQKHKTATTDK